MIQQEKWFGKPSRFSYVSVRWALAVTVLWLCGCALHGEWHAVSLPADLPGRTDQAIMSAVTFKPSGQYAATETAGNNRHTSVGRYVWRWNRLTLTPDGGPERALPCRLGWDGSLVIRYDDPPPALDVIMKRRAQR